ncbi:MAG TPA: class I SAM-dependent methyltransferase [Cytophagaceae bacterium]|jgi:tRNA (cmo5U34)-methyltransferase
MNPLENKSSIEEIRVRFDNDVERFSNLETGQISTLDANFSLELITESARRMNPKAKTLLDVGCGAGNYTLKMLGKIPNLECTLVDLSQAMISRAVERISPHTSKKVKAIKSDIREANLAHNCFDIVLAGAVLHHLRDDEDWKNVFEKLYAILKPGGCLMICDMVVQNDEIVTKYVWELYGQYLENLKDKEYREKVLAYVEKEDSPRSIIYQLELIKEVGFTKVDILHKNLNFAVIMGIK